MFKDILTSIVRKLIEQFLLNLAKQAGLDIPSAPSTPGSTPAGIPLPKIPGLSLQAEPDAVETAIDKTVRDFLNS